MEEWQHLVLKFYDDPQPHYKFNANVIDEISPISEVQSLGISHTHNLLFYLEAHT